MELHNLYHHSQTIIKLPNQVRREKSILLLGSQAMPTCPPPYSFLFAPTLLLSSLLPLSRCLKELRGLCTLYDAGMTLKLISNRLRFEGLTAVKMSVVVF